MMLRLARSCVTSPAWVSSLRWNDKVFGGMPKPLGHGSRRQAGRASDDQGSEHLQPDGLCERRQRLNDVFLFHGSTLVELWKSCPLPESRARGAPQEAPPQRTLTNGRCWPLARQNDRPLVLR